MQKPSLYNRWIEVSHRRIADAPFLFGLKLEQYVNAAIVQWHRIQQDDAMTWAAMDEDFGLLHEGVAPTPEVMQLLRVRYFADIHSFLIMVDKAQILFRGLVKADGGADLQGLWERSKIFLKRYNDFRNDLEHIDERIARGLVEPGITDLGNVLNDTYTFSGKIMDIGPEGLKFLTDMYDEILAVVAARPKRPSQPEAPPGNSGA